MLFEAPWTLTPSPFPVYYAAMPEEAEIQALPTDPIFEKPAEPFNPGLTKMIAHSSLLRRGSKYATQMFMQRVEELQLKGLNCDPIQILMEIASGKQLNDNGTITTMVPPPEAAVRQKAAAELCAYIFPKRKAVEISTDPERPVQFVVMPDTQPLPGAKDVVTLDASAMNQLIEKSDEDSADISMEPTS